MSSEILFVSGAPGAGKSTVAPIAATMAGGSALVFDMDELLDVDGAILDIPIRSPESAGIWRPYNGLWLRIVGLIVRSGLPVILFGPLTPAEVQAADSRAELQLRFALLDCSDHVRVRRLRARGWRDDPIAQALEDAAQLRYELADRISSEDDPKNTAREVLNRVLGDPPVVTP